MKSIPSKKVLRRMGLNDDQEGIMKRYLNEAGSWDSHLQSTRNFIIHCISDNQPMSVGILGSGWLLDVPANFLMDNCEKVFFYDIRHPRQITNKYKQEEKFNFIDCDITGGAIESVYNSIKNKTVETELLTIPQAGFQPNESLDYIVSVNVLNQLDILIVENLRKIKNLDAQLIKKFRTIIQSSHLKSLPTDKSCLITDFEEQLYDRTGMFVENRSLLYTELPNAKYEQEWIWNFDTQMTYYPNRKTNFKVIAKQF